MHTVFFERCPCGAGGKVKSEHFLLKLIGNCCNFLFKEIFFYKSVYQMNTILEIKYFC